MSEIIKIHEFTEAVEMTSTLTTGKLYISLKENNDKVFVIIPITKVKELIDAVDML